MAELLMVDLSSRRIWLHMVNFCVGMSIFVSAYSFATSISADIYGQMAKFGTNLVMLSDKHAYYASDVSSTLDKRAYDLLRSHLAKEYQMTSVLLYRGRISNGSSRLIYLNVWEVQPNFFSIVKLPFVRGRPFTSFEDSLGTVGCVFGPLIGFDSVVLSLGSSITVENASCRLDGVVAREGIAGTFSTAWDVFISATNLPYRASVVDPPVTQIFLSKRSGDLDPAISDRIIQLLKVKYDVSQLIVWSAKQYWETRIRITHQIGVLIVIIATVIVGLAAVGLGNGLLLDVALRRGEIGLRMALGATRANVFFMILREGMAIVAYGGGLGIGIGLILLRFIVAPLAARGLADQTVVVTIDPWGVVVCLATLFLVAMVASVLPAGRAALVEPSVALRDL
jgi:putative ABC transport system permease protein